MITSEYITVAEFLTLYRVGRTTFYRLANAGELPLVKLGRATRIRRSDAERWAASLPVKPSRGGAASPRHGGTTA